MAKHSSQVSGLVLVGFLSWIIALSIYLLFDPTTVIFFSLRTGTPLHAQSGVWLFSFIGLISFVVAFKKWWF